jgi:hypothetical protein
MGAAVYGPESCTCKTPLSDKETNWRKKYRAAAKSLLSAMDRIAWLEQELSLAGRQNIHVEVRQLKLVKR